MAPVAQISSHTPRTVSPIALGKTRADRRRQLYINARPFALRPFPPGVISGTRHLKGLAQPRQGPDILALGDRREPHVGSLTKNPMVFFRISRSALTRISSLFSRATSASSRS